MDSILKGIQGLTEQQTLPFAALPQNISSTCTANYAETQSKHLMYYTPKSTYKNSSAHRCVSEIIFYIMGLLFFLREFLDNSVGKYKCGVTAGKEYFLFVFPYNEVTLKPY